jgi:hypothetical protein
MSGCREWFADFIHFTDSGAGVMAGLLARQIASAQRLSVGSLSSQSSAGGDGNAPPLCRMK